MLVPDRAYRAQWETGTGTLMIEEKADAMPVYLGPPGSSIADMAAVLAVSTQPRTGVPSGTQLAFVELQIAKGGH